MDPQFWPDLLELKESRRGMDAGGLIAMHLSICIKGDVIKIKVSIVMLMYTLLVMEYIQRNGQESNKSHLATLFDHLPNQRLCTSANSTG